jgi:predicted transcriptional regulator
MPDGYPKPDKVDFNVCKRSFEVLIHAGGEIRKTHFQNRTNTNPDTSSRCLDWMISRGYVEMRRIDARHVFVKITDKGRRAARKLREFMEGNSES